LYSVIKSEDAEALVAHLEYFWKQNKKLSFNETEFSAALTYVNGVKVPRSESPKKRKFRELIRTIYFSGNEKDR